MSVASSGLVDAVAGADGAWLLDGSTARLLQRWLWPTDELVVALTGGITLPVR